MKVHIKKFSIIIILSLLAFVMTSTVCSAQGYSRSDKGEIYGMVQTMSGNTSDFDPSYWSLENSFELDDSTVFGFGIGFNVTDHWNLNTDLLFGSADYARVARRPGSSTTITGDADLFLWDVNVDYNILTGQITPLVTAGIGFVSLDSDNLFDETNFSYNLGAGGRWDITNNIFVKAIYRITWTELDDAEDNIDFDGISLSVGYMF